MTSLTCKSSLDLPPTAIVIGAGIAGASMARQLAERGIAVTVFERDELASGGSGNPVAVVRPEPGGEQNPITELSTTGVSWLMDWISTNAQSVPHDWCGAFRIARDQRRHDKLAQQARLLGDACLREVDTVAARNLCGVQPAAGGFFIPQSGWVRPVALVSAFLDHPLIHVRTRMKVERLHPVKSDAQGRWELQLSDGSKVITACVVLASAFAEGLSPVDLAIDSARGQLSCLPERADRPLHTIVCRDGYITPAINGVHTIGATIQYDDDQALARPSDDEENFQRLQRLLPDFASDVSELSSGRVAWRATTQDRLPLVGKIAEGLFASLGHGSRGVACGPLCAEFLSALICAEPLPLGPEWIARLDPLRLVRQH